MKGIYCYIDLNTNKVVYVGKDSHISKNARHKQHIAPSQYNAQHINKVLQNNLQRYEYKVLKQGDFSKNLLNALEILYIRRYSPMFNFTIGGDGGTGYKQSKEQRENHSKAMSGKGNPMYGKHHTLESRKKMSENRDYASGKNHPQYGKKVSKKICKKLALSKNTSGYYRVYLRKEKGNAKDRWVYRYTDETGKRKQISSIDLHKLEEKVKLKGLEWFKINPNEN